MQEISQLESKNMYSLALAQAVASEPAVPALLLPVLERDRTPATLAFRE